MNFLAFAMMVSPLTRRIQKDADFRNNVLASTVVCCQFVERESIELLTTYKQLRGNEQFRRGATL